MNIYNSSGTAIFTDVPLTTASELVQELMRSDYVQLVWRSASNTIIPAGSYINIGREKYSLIEPYSPEQRSEAEWEYRPQFVSEFYTCAKVPFFMYTTTSGVTTKEADWVLTDNPLNFLTRVQTGILTETGLKYDKVVDNTVQVASATVEFNCMDIISACTSIANAFETELWLEKFSAADSDGYIGRLHLGKAQFGTAVNLEVGTNIKVPSVTKNGEYFNRFYVFGSSRNIVQANQGSTISNVAVKRLTLNPTTYPYGYIDFSNGGPVYSKILQFDEVYPSATDLVVFNLRTRTRYRLDENTSKPIIIGGTEEEPVYDTYVIWYFQMKRKVGSSYIDFYYSDAMALPGLVPSIHFNSGPLAGREFEVIYHEHGGEVQDGADPTPFEILDNDFEIKFQDENGLIIPSIVGLVPQTDNLIVLFNVQMPGNYTTSAQERLATVAFAEINKNYLNITTGEQTDLNSYQVQSDPTVFHTNEPTLALGSKINYINGSYSKETRVTALRKRLDLTCYQTIVFGDEIVKGNIEELKEEAVSANQNIDLLAALNKSTSEITAAYERTHQLILKQLADNASLWLKQEVTIGGETKQIVKLNPVYVGVTADGFGSFGGLNPGSSSGQTDLLDVWVSLSHNTDEYANWKIDAHHFPLANGGGIGIDGSGNLYVTTVGGVSSVAGLTGAITEAQLAQAMGIGTIANGDTHLVTGGTVYSYINTYLSSAISFAGVSSTAITNGGTETPTINGSAYTQKKGDVVLYNGLEFLWDGSHWVQFGDESSYALKTVKIIGGTGISVSGTGTLEQDRTVAIEAAYVTKIDHGETAYNAITDYFEKITVNGVTYIHVKNSYGFVGDSFGSFAGLNSGSGGGGGDFDEAAMWEALDTDYQTQIIALSHLPMSTLDARYATAGNYLPLNGGTMNNTNLVTNLNADLLDGIHASNFYARPATQGFEISSWNDFPANITDGLIRGIIQGVAYVSVLQGSDGYGSTWQMRFSANSAFPDAGAIYFRINSSEWKELAFTDSNVASATKLQTARTIWGQSFDGTGNVSGNITNAGNIEMAGAISGCASISNNYYSLTHADSTLAFLRLSGEYPHIQIKNNNIYNAGISFLDNSENVIWTISYRGENAADKDLGLFNDSTNSYNIWVKRSNGNVGIGTTSPSYKLDVNGNMNVTSDLYALKGVNLVGVNDTYTDSTGATRPWHGLSGNYASGTPADEKTVLASYEGITVKTNNMLYYFKQSGLGIGESSPQSSLHLVSGATLRMGPSQYLEWDATNTCWKLNGNLAVTGFVSSGGVSAGSGADFDEAAMWMKLADDNSSDAQSKLINPSHLAKLNISNGTAESGKYISAITYSNGTFSVTKESIPATGVTSITAGTGLSGGTIISTGTISLDVEGAKTALGLGTMAYEAAGNYIPMSGTGNNTVSGWVTFDYGVGLAFMDGNNAEHSIRPFADYNYDLAHYDNSSWRRIWDSGNDGSGSGLDADLLDGYHKASYMFKEAAPYTGTIDANTFTTNMTVYATETDLSSATLSNFPVSYSAGGYAIININHSAYGFQLGEFYGNNALFFRCKAYDGGVIFLPWKQVATTDGNIATATALATTRYFWGNVFNGSADVTGSLWNVPAVFLGEQAAGIYLHYHGISWHDATNAWTRDIVTFTSGGNVGIGHTDPQTMLSVRGDISLMNSADVQNDGNALVFPIVSRGTLAYIKAVWEGIDWSAANVAFGRLAFVNATTSGLSEMLTLASNGCVGIGNNSPSYKLDVNGIANATFVRSTYIYNTHYAVGDANTLISSNFSGLDLETIAATNIYFRTNSSYSGNTIRMVLNSLGNLTLGSSDLASNSYKMYVDGTILAVSEIYAYKGVSLAGVGDSYTDSTGTTRPWHGLSGNYTSGTPADEKTVLASYEGVTLKTSSQMYYFKSTGLGIGNNSPSYTLDITGTANVTTYVRTPYVYNSEYVVGAASSKFGVSYPGLLLEAYQASTPIYLRTNGYQRMKIDGDGKVHIGHTQNATDSYIEFDDANNAFHFHGSAYFDGFVSSGGLNQSTGEWDNYTGVMKLQTNVTSYGVQIGNASNRVGVGGAPSSTYKFYVTGTAGGSYSWNSASDARLKTNIERMDYEEAIHIIMALKPSKWIWNDNCTLHGQQSAGLIAQEVQPVMPYAVSGTDYLSLTYSSFVAPVVATLQSHEERIKVLEKEIERLRAN